MSEQNPPNVEQIPKVRLPKPHLVNGIPVSFPTAEAEFLDDEPNAADPIAKAIDVATQPQPTPPPQPKAPAKKRQPKAAPAPAPTPIASPTPSAPVAAEPLPEEAPVTQPKNIKTLTGANAIAVFKQAVGAGSIPVTIYSIDREVMMRELTVTDQKSLSKTALINNNRRDIMYDAQNGLINNCVQTPGFDIREYTEFDRVVFLLRLYQQNYFSNDIHYTCPKCGKENVYKLDFGKVLERVKAAWTNERSYVLTHGDKEFHFTIAWPKVSTISQFYAAYYKQYQKANEKTQSTIDQMSNVEYLVMFIKGIELVFPTSNEGVSLNLDDYTYEQRSDLIDSLPQGLVFDDKTGVVSKIIADFTNPLNKAFQYEKCQFCGAETEEGIGSIADFI